MGEQRGPHTQRALRAVRELIAYVGYNPDNAELVGTPERVVKFLDEMRTVRDEEVVPTTFDGYTPDDLVAVRNVTFYSLCAHHMLPFFGHMDVGYLPNGRLLGLSKIPRLIRKFSSGLTTQERLTHAVAEAVREAADTKDVAVQSTAMHTCASMRGARADGVELAASAMLGGFRSDPALRAEFISMVRKTQ